MNFEYIAEILCINKGNEVLQCNGSCHITKEILAIDQEGKPEYPQPSFEKFPNLFLEKQLIYSHNTHHFPTHKGFYISFAHYENNIKTPPFPPPQFVM